MHLFWATTVSFSVPIPAVTCVFHSCSWTFRLESDGSMRSVTDSPRIFSALSASISRVRFSLRSPIVTSLGLMVALFAFFWYNPELCYRSPPFGACNRLLTSPPVFLRHSCLHAPFKLLIVHLQLIYSLCMPQTPPWHYQNKVTIPWPGRD